MQERTKIIHVTCAIIEHDGKVLVTQRSMKMSLPGKWEFPGGKLEDSELPEDCIVREIHEELAIDVEVRLRLPETRHANDNRVIHLIPFICEWTNGQIVLHEHMDYRWMDPAEMYSLDWAEADVDVLESYLG